MNDRVSRPTAESTDTADGRHARWDAHRVARREELIAAATAAIAAHGGDVGMDRIAAAAGTSKPVIYRYFTDRDELHRAVGRHVAGEIVRTLQDVHTGPATTDAADPQALLHRAIDAYLRLVEQRPTLFRFVITLPQGPLQPVDPIAGVLTTELAHHLAACGLDPAGSSPWGDAAVGFIRAASLWWLDHPDAMDRAQLTEYLAALLWGGAAGVFRSAGVDVDPRPAPGVFARTDGSS